MGISVKKHNFVRKKLQKRKIKTRRKIRFSKKRFSKKRNQRTFKKNKKKRKKMLGGTIIYRGTSFQNKYSVDGNGVQLTSLSPPPLTQYLSYPPFFQPGLSTSVVVKFRNQNNDLIPTHLYGTSFPDQVDGCNGLVSGCIVGSRMYRTMGYFMYGKGVNKWVSLQACGDPATARPHNHRHPNAPFPCQGDPNGPPGLDDINRAQAENLTWLELKDLVPTNEHNTNIEMLDILITDMQVGKMSSWIEINKLDNFEVQPNSAVFHCLAGFGRTGTVFLFYILRNFFKQQFQQHMVTLQQQQQQRINPLDIHYLLMREPNSESMYNNLKDELRDSISFHCCHITNNVNDTFLPQRVNNNSNNYWTFTPDMIVNEVMNIAGGQNDADLNSQFNANLLISRINTIIVTIWYYIYITPGVCDVINRPVNWDCIYLYYMSSAPNWVGPRVPSNTMTPALLFSQSITIYMGPFFQQGGLQAGLNMANRVPGYHGGSLINFTLQSITDNFGIQF